MNALTPAQRRHLKALAHPLHPVVSIGNGGLSEAVLKEADKTLAKHELIKVKVHSDERATREAVLAALCEALGAAPVQHIGKILVIYRPTQEPVISLNGEEAPRKKTPAAPKEAAPQARQGRGGKSDEAPRGRPATGKGTRPAPKRGPAQDAPRRRTRG